MNYSEILKENKEMIVSICQTQTNYTNVTIKDAMTFILNNEEMYTTLFAKLNDNLDVFEQMAQKAVDLGINFKVTELSERFEEAQDLRKKQSLGLANIL